MVPVRQKLQVHVRSLGKKPSIAQKNDLQERRLRLKAQIDKFMREALKLIPLMDKEQVHLVSIIDHNDDLEDIETSEGVSSVIEMGDSNGDGDDEWEVDDDVEENLPEAVKLLLPSALTSSQRNKFNIQVLGKQEAQLWEGQANDALEGIRNSLAQVSLVFRTQVRNSKSVHTRTRSWRHVQQTNAVVQRHVTAYKTARNALIQLGAPPEVCSQFLEISREHLKMPGDIVEANRVGQRSDSLPCFWRLDGKKSGKQDQSMKEC